MKVTIFGSYNGGSIGDTAILLGMISSIFRVLGDGVEVTVLALGSVGVNEELEELDARFRVTEALVNRRFDNSFPAKYDLLNKGWRYLKRARSQPPLNKNKIRRVLQNSDVLLIGGGNLVMDLYESWPKILKSVCCLAKDLSVPYFFVGVGSAPIDTSQGKQDLLGCLKYADGVFFRDSMSKEYCAHRLGFDKASVGPDLAFGIDYSQRIKSDKDDVLMLNLASVYSERWPVKDPEKYEKYLSNMVHLVDFFVERLGIEELVIFNTNYPLDELAAEDFLGKYEKASRAPVSLDFTRGRNTVAGLLSACSKAKFSLVTRLHAGIISKISGAQVFAIEYQPKVRDVLQNQTSTTIVESFDAVLSGTAFESIGQDILSNETKKDHVSHNEVDTLMEHVFSQCKVKVG